MILFFGPPGSGKSVQGQLLVERNKWRWVSTGELFRKSQDPEVLKRIKTGGLIDDELTNKVLDDELKQIGKEFKVVLDGYPRNQDQAEWLDSQLAKYGREVDCVVLFKVPREELLRRLMGRGREEDLPEVIEHRLDIYQQKTQPVIDYYKARGVSLLEVDGAGDINEIHERIQSAVKRCLQLA